MKWLVDLIPLLGFFITYRVSAHHAEASAQWATRHFGPWVQGSVVLPSIAPVLLATLVVIVLTLLQVAVMLLRRQRISPVVWLSTTLLVGLGGATVWLQSEAFIKWKPTLLYGLMALAMAGSLLVWRRNPLTWLLSAHLQVPPKVWAGMAWAWVVFFLALATLNLWVAQTFDTDTWVTFKLVGLTVLPVAFSVLMLLAVQRWVTEPGATDSA